MSPVKQMSKPGPSPATVTPSTCDERVVYAASLEDSKPRTLSIVIPVFNESESLRELYRQINAVLAMLPQAAEIVFVDDGSKDGSWQTIRELRSRDPRICGIRFRKNCGKAAALAVGFSECRGDVVFTMDADLQDDPSEIPNFLRRLAEGLDVVSGWKQVRHDPWHKTFPSKIFNWLVGVVTGTKLHDHNCGFKCYRQQVLKNIRLYGEFHRFIPVLVAAEGYQVGEISVHHRPRQHGISKYGWRRFARGLLDLLTIKFLTSYENRPQHLLGGLGLVAITTGLSGLIYLTALWSMNFLSVAEFGPIGNRPLLILSATVLILGVQLTSLGLIAELITARNDERSFTRFLEEVLPGEAVQHSHVQEGNDSASSRSVN